MVARFSGSLIAMARELAMATTSEDVDDSGYAPCRWRSAETPTPPHEAHWYVSFSCGCRTAVCTAHRRRVEAEGGWACSPRCRNGCRGYHTLDQISFVRM